MADNPCPLYSQHQMRTQGFASVSDESGVKIQELNGGGWYKCGCGERFICWGQPHSRLPITYYVTEGAIKAVTGGTSGVSGFRVVRSMVRFTDSTTLPGYLFL
ncbi:MULTISPECIES: hypothetical protein [Paenibacillus]|uniref:hypothetical protein n=2 Tax=Paenibacillus TaxID=44249 RepID=UPI0007E3F0C7|nr:hypothetical protein [Paenibacillus sp. AD87]OAX50802.1 hypothetical protein gpAD87_21595 [Paenibacillus sp. AD87]OAX50809.1 hypothetical protein gpAD87_21630 [Paenibacillus sp. AD87]OAX50811.1 hypothetical protein gpAD87_21640 [Paenibacillus sp. AD87]